MSIHFCCTALERRSVPPHSASIVYNELNEKMAGTRDNLDEAEGGGTDAISNCLG